MIKIYVKDETEEAFAKKAMVHQVAFNPLILGAAYEIVLDVTRAGTIEGTNVEIMANLKNIVFPSPLGAYADFDLRR